MSGRVNWYFRQKVTEAELDLAFALLEQADRAVTVDASMVGVQSGMVVTQHAGGVNLTIDVSAGVAYSKLGERIYVPSLANVDVSRDENGVPTAVSLGGNSKIISIYAKATRLLTDPRSDGNSVSVYFNAAESFAFVVRQGAESATPTPSVVDPVYVLLADITIAFGQTTIVSANIATPLRREDAYVRAGLAYGYSLRQGTVLTAFQSVVDSINALVNRTIANDTSIVISGATYTASIAEYANGIITIGSSIFGASLVLPDPVSGAGRIRNIVNNSLNDVTITTPFSTSPVVIPSGVSLSYALFNTAPGVTSIVPLTAAAGPTLGMVVAMSNGFLPPF